MHLGGPQTKHLQSLGSLALKEISEFERDISPVRAGTPKDPASTQPIFLFFRSIGLAMGVFSLDFFLGFVIIIITAIIIVITSRC